jgi:hypothetical protein
MNLQLSEIREEEKLCSIFATRSFLCFQVVRELGVNMSEL